MSEANWKNGQQTQEEQEFEQALARSLRRVEAPRDFLAKVMAQAEETGNRKQEAGRSEGPWDWLGAFVPRWGWKPAWGAVAAVLVSGVLMGHVVHERHAAEQAQVQASREFDVSVQITDKTMDHVREQLRKAGVTLDEGQ